MSGLDLAPLFFLVEDILNQLIPESPREAVLARVAAGRARFAGDFTEAANQLELARRHIGDANGRNWRDVLRANIELGTLLASLARYDDALPRLECAFTTLDKFFGVHNDGSRALSELIGFVRGQYTMRTT